MPKLCDQRTVGVLITRTVADTPHTLLITRGTAPAGVAPVAGHQDLDAGADHGRLTTPEDVARAETREEVGLETTRLRPLLRDVWVPTWCRRTLPAGATEHGHRWTVYRAEATGALAPDERETRGAAWYAPDDVDALALRTLAYSRGRMSDAAWLAEPGLEPVWVLLLHIARRLPTALSRTDLDTVAALAQAPEQLASRLPA